MDIKVIADKKKQFVTQTVGNEIILVPLKDKMADMNEAFTLNEVGAFIWENINDVNTVEHIAAKITQEFDVDEESAIKDLKEFLILLKAYLIK